MKIGVISDLHIDANSKEQYTKKDFEEALANELVEQKVDLALIAGDISNDHKLSYTFIKNVEKRINKKVLFVPGNHDYWDEVHDTKDTTLILDYFKQKKEVLIEKPFIINDEWAIVGHSGWYDYTFADGRFSIDELSERNYNGRTWKDKLYTDWKVNDRELSRRFAEVVRQDLEKVKNKKIILMTHMVTNKNFAVKMPHKVFDYFNAFIGTSDFDELIENYPIVYTIMGHVHHRESESESGRTHICACLGNINEWKSNNLDLELKDAMQIIH